jgi:hypothetical protein
MGKVLEFALLIPSLCDAEDPERWAFGIKAAYNEEKGKPSVFQRTKKDKEEPGRRLRVVFGFTAFKHDAGKAAHCFNLLKLWELAHYRDEHGETEHEAEIANLRATAEIVEEQYPEIAAVMSAKTASENGGW